MVVFVFPAFALASELLVWVTGPSLPGLSIRTTTFTFVGATWVDVAAELLFCVVGADWLDVWDWPVSSPEPASWVACAWELCCWTSFLFAALLSADDPLLCLAAPAVE